MICIEASEEGVNVAGGGGYFMLGFVSEDQDLK